MYGESGSLFYFMIIKSIEPHLLSCPLEEPAVYRFHGGVRTIYKRDAMVVRIETEDGTVGYAPGAASEDNARMIEKEIAPLLVGRKLMDPSSFVEDQVDQKGDSIWSAAGAVEVALFDLWGKANQCSVTEFLAEENSRLSPATEVLACINRRKRMPRKRRRYVNRDLKSINTARLLVLQRTSGRLN